MTAKNVVFGWIAGPIEYDAIDRSGGEAIEFGGGDLIGFDQPQVELNVGCERVVIGQDREGFAIRGASYPHRAEFFGQANGPRPKHEGLFNPAIGLGVLG
jgi:hypothetical protein